MKDEVYFLPGDKCLMFLQSNTASVCVARHGQIKQNNKFVISLQHVKKEVSDALDFLHADKH